ncbi:MAG: type VI secretion system contractile sheath large subunit [Tateyamaria sp.]|uniref:type VI secretion system contractile sheath domain-containing protein n=1 Tax=Tateyamaria sp. TaxID=1929288 RepID=UPI00328552B1
MDALLAGLESGDEDESSEGDDDLDALLADLDNDAEVESVADDDLDALLAGLSDDTDVASDEGDDDMDALLAELDGDDGDEDAGGDDDLDALLAGLDDDADEDSGGDDDLDTLLAGLDDDDGDADEDGSTDGDSAEAAEAPAEPVEPVQSPFGLISQPRPSRADLNRTKFRMAVFGDFTGRAARGLMETGDALASRKAIPLDVDTIDEIIEGFGTTLVLPIGADGAGVEVKLGEMDDLHPDELYDNVELFEAISGVRRQLGVGSMADRAVDQLKSWSETYSTPIKLPKTSAGASMPANLKLSDFQALIGDTRGTLTQATPADEMIARIIGPHVVKAPDAGAAAMQAAVDEALSSAMNLILHHPEFQAIESQWRSLDLLARRIETDVKLEIVLYDVSAEELAADLAAQEDLSESGLFKLVTDVLEPEEGAGGFSALFGLYTFEETPPHAELLARIGQVGLHVDAPFFSAISPSYLDTAPEDRHPLVAKTWDTLRQMPEAAYVALAAPRFLLRQPYGAKSDPVYAFEFEEFSPQEGLKGMLWANPVVLIAILLAGTYKGVGKAAAMDLGSIMTLGDLPFYYVNDRYGDQVALPCTERNLTTDPAQATLTRGYMPVLWMKGRNDIRLGSFRSLGGDTIAGPWQEDVPKPRKSPKSADLDVEIDVSTDDDDVDEDTSLDDLLSGLEDDASDDDDDDMSLDDLLAGFDDDDADASDDDDDEMDPELAALLEGL